jgi:leukotriene-A4 hydrolase
MKQAMARLDPHSYADGSQPRTRAFDWSAVVDFETKQLRAEVTLQLSAPAASDGPFDLDTRALTIESVTGAGGAALKHTLHPADPVLGARLEVQLPKGCTEVKIRYRTAPDASALQWLEPSQTLGGKLPYLFSQCQAIHARSVLPCQDTPSIRQTYTAALEVPPHLTAVMAAAPRGREKAGDKAIDRFEMPQPIPPYLFAFALGELVSRELSPRSRVWAEPGQVDAAAREFSDVEAMMKAAEALFGPYDWERFDLLVMPPSFPYGGMENPRLTFLTPALVTGDKSQVNVVAHELAHSWTGNLVTNSTAEHFWLNEGFTVFAERRILEALEGAEVAGLHAALGFESLQKALEQFKGRPELTRLRTELWGVDPDEAFSVVPYEKGYLFLKALELAVGGARFDSVLKAWLQGRRFGAATTDDFTAHIEKSLPGILGQVRASEWLDSPGLPAAHFKPESARLKKVRRVAGKVPTKDEAKAWSPTEWQLYLDASPRPMSVADCRKLDETFALSASKNPEVLVSWLELALESGDATVVPTADAVLGRFGRMKYLKPLYKALCARPELEVSARTAFDKYQSRYHPIARQVIAGLLAKH